MPSVAHAPRLAGIRIRTLNSQPALWLPCLYATGTILQLHPSHQSAWKPTSSQHVASKNASRRWFTQRSLPKGRISQQDFRKPDTYTAMYRDEGNASSAMLEAASDSYEVRPTYQDQHSRSRSNSYNTRPRGQHRGVLPFEKPKKRSRLRFVSEDSTVTTSEATVFQSLLSLQDRVHAVLSKAKDTSATTTAVGAKTDQEPDLYATVSRAIGAEIPREPNAFVDLVKTKELLKLTDADSKPVRAVRRVISLMQDAQTDSRLWEILQEEAITPFLALKFDDSTAAMSKKRQAKADDTSSLDIDIDMLMQTFPKLLISFQDILHKTFPSSPYALALLPCLRQLGSSAFALGASTELYNHHLRALYRQRTDVAAMVKTLQDMHGNVFDFDAETQSLVQRVVDDASYAMSRHDGSGRKAFWKNDLMQQTLRELTTWADKIGDGVCDRAMNDVRDVMLSTPRPGYVEQYRTLEDDEDLPLQQAYAG